MWMDRFWLGLAPSLADVHRQIWVAVQVPLAPVFVQLPEPAVGLAMLPFRLAPLLPLAAIFPALSTVPVTVKAPCELVQLPDILPLTSTTTLHEPLPDPV